MKYQLISSETGWKWNSNGNIGEWPEIWTLFNSLRAKNPDVVYHIIPY